MRDIYPWQPPSRLYPHTAHGREEFLCVCWGAKKATQGPEELMARFFLSSQEAGIRESLGDFEGKFYLSLSIVLENAT